MTAGCILVVEDDEDIRETVIDALSDEGFAVIGAGDGAEALAILRGSTTLPALILLDLMMPGMNGPEFVAEKRADPLLAAVPLIILSADANVGATAAALGVAEFLRKPVRLDVLIATARRFSTGS